MEHAVRHAHVSECKAGLPVANGIIFVPQFPIHVTHARKCKATLPVGNKFIFAMIPHGFRFVTWGIAVDTSATAAGWRADTDSRH